MQSTSPCKNCGEPCAAKTGLCRKCYQKWWYNQPTMIEKRANSRQQNKPLTPQQIPVNARAGFDFTRQERRAVVEGKNMTAMHILARCTECSAERWVKHKKARQYMNSYCQKCSRSLTHRGKPKGKGWYLTNGYKVIDINRFYPEWVDYIRRYLEPDSCRYGNFYREHRVVALLHYGPELVKPGVLIRHLDGNKLNNVPSNLLPGTPQENSTDHAEAVAEMKCWRAIAFMLLRELHHLGHSSVENL